MCTVPLSHMVLSCYLVINKWRFVTGYTQWTRHETEKKNNKQLPSFYLRHIRGHFVWNCSQLGLKMSGRARSHTDLQTAGKTSGDDSLRKSFSMSNSGSNNRGGPFGCGVTEEIKILARTPRRPVRVVRPVSAVTSGGSFLQINHLQGELVRKRKVRTHKRCKKTLKLESWVFLKSALNVHFRTFAK